MGQTLKDVHEIIVLTRDILRGAYCMGWSRRCSNSRKSC